MTSQGTEQVGQVLAHLCSPPDLQKKKGGAEGLPLAVLLPHAYWDTQHLVASAPGSPGISKDPQGGAAVRATQWGTVCRNNITETGTCREGSPGLCPEQGQGWGRGGGHLCMEKAKVWSSLVRGHSDPMGPVDPRPLSWFTALGIGGSQFVAEPQPQWWGCLLGRCSQQGENCHLKPKLPVGLALPSRAVDGSCQQENDTTLPRGDVWKGTGRTLPARALWGVGDQTKFQGPRRSGPPPPALVETYFLN